MLHRRPYISYLDNEVIIAVHDLLTIIWKVIMISNATVDGTDYHLTVRKNNETPAKKVNDKAKGS